MTKTKFELKLPNIGKCQEVFDKFHIEDDVHTKATSQLCAIILMLEEKIPNQNLTKDNPC